MEDLQNIQVNFDQNQIWLLNICLGILMFGVSLDIDFKLFRDIIKTPKSIFVGIFSQWILLPIITLILIFLLKPEPSLAMGMLLIAACPGGNVSNYAVHLAKGNSHLSIIMTTISTLFCVVTTPLLFFLGKKILFSLDSNLESIEINFFDMVITVIELIIVPLIIAQLILKYAPILADKIKKPIKHLSLIIFIAFVIVAVIGNWQNIYDYLYIVFYLVLIHNSSALVLGYFVPRYMFNVTNKDAITISIETGIQNSGLALILIFNFFGGTGGMALIAAWWSVWHLLGAMLVVFFVSRNKS